MTARIQNDAAGAILARLDLGSTIAETDNLLEAARVETSVFDDLFGDRVDLIPGTKGSGKSALYRIFVDFLPSLMLKQRRVVIAHGVQDRQDNVFLAFKEQFDTLSEPAFQDFWCIYLVSLANEQFIKNPKFQSELAGYTGEVSAFKAAYQSARIPDFDRPKSLKEIIGWGLTVLGQLRPTVRWKPSSSDGGQLELSVDVSRAANAARNPADAEPKMPEHVEPIVARLHDILERADLSLWLMVDKLDELFARRSETERRALRGLLRALRLFNSSRVRLKVFLRDDIFEHIVKPEGFTALTHVTARMADTLRWSEEQILAMIVKRLAAGAEIRAFLDLNESLLKTSPEYQRQTFYRIFDDTVYRPPNQSPTLRWIYNHCKDGRGVVTPRDVIQLVTRASQKQRDLFSADPSGITERLLYGPAIVYGLDELSRAKRTNYLEAEFPHKWTNIRKLVGGGTEYSHAALRRLFGRTADAVIEDLVSIGVLSRGTRQGDSAYKVPFLYRRGLECTQRFIG